MPSRPPIRPSRLRNIAACTAAALLCLLPSATATAAPARPADTAGWETLDTYVRDRMAATDTPGLAYAVVGPDGPIHRRVLGSDGDGRPVTASTPFLWGSVSKPITATAVLTLVEDGRLALDEPVTEHLPGFRFGGPEHAGKVTVRHLLGHTSGIPESAIPLVTDCFRTDCPAAADRVGALDGIDPLGPPGTVHAYSSANYVVLTAVAEAVTGQPLADLLREAVFSPAGMDGAFADRASARDRGLPPGHQLLWGVHSAVADGVDDHGAGYGYTGGGLDDLAAFASFQLRATDGVLSSGAVRLMREEATLRPGGAGTGYGLGWQVGGLDAPLDGAVWHAGVTPGYSAALFLLPERDLALVLEQNLYGFLENDAMMAVAFGAARIVAGGDAPADAPSALLHHASVWGVTGLALALTLAAGRSLVLLRRPARPTGPGRRAVVTASWGLLGALPCAALAVLAATDRLGFLRIWVPDLHIALWTAAVAGAVTATLRLALAIRAARGRTGGTAA
ncbi:serine hydrolase domain-containing protein [Streptomyces sp. RFCAC02]|uniref:serine hydrolase domain-containing protein n=1 Tax=Streptomyces sp. RFCAC02 TaxID=2499143 RepID=UPI00101FEB76|nr:serine hydrolase domain-containing protein [Streptomyces sp. RFCAC02]